MWQEMNSESEDSTTCHSLPSRARSIVDNTDENSLIEPIALCEKVLQATSINPEAE
jgi:hypothetical protein